jgi:hypothetical protein
MVSSEFACKSGDSGICDSLNCRWPVKPTKMAMYRIIDTCGESSGDDVMLEAFGNINPAYVCAHGEQRAGL